MVSRRMAHQFTMPIEVAAGETTRATDGLALSSCSGYLLPAECEEPVQLSLALTRMGEQLRATPRSGAVESEAMAALAQRGWSCGAELPPYPRISGATTRYLPWPERGSDAARSTRGPLPCSVRCNVMPLTSMTSSVSTKRCVVRVSRPEEQM